MALPGAAFGGAPSSAAAGASAGGFNMDALMNNPLLLGLLQQSMEGGGGQGDASTPPIGAGVKPGVPPQGGAPMPQGNPALLGLTSQGLDPMLFQQLLAQRNGQ